MRGAVVVLVLAACGRVNFDPLASDGDGGPGGDAVVADAACALGPWSAPVALTQLNSPMDDLDPSLTSDGLTLYFSNSRTGSRDIWSATRTAIGAPWSTPAVVPEFSEADDEEGNPDISSNGLEMYFGMSRVFRATRTATTLPFADREIISDAPEYTSAIGVQVSHDGLELYFGAQPAAGATQKQIYRMRRAQPSGAWGPAMLLPIDMPDRESGFVAISPDGLELMISRLTADMGWELLTMRRPSLDEEFDPTTLAEVTELNTTSGDADAEISATSREVIFNSDRPGGMGGYDLYVSTRDCL